MGADRSTLPWRPTVRTLIFADDGVVARKGTRDDGTATVQFPGGGIDNGETPEQAALREAKEETGVAMDSPRLHTAFKFTWPAGTQRTQKQKDRYAQFQGEHQHLVVARYDGKRRATSDEGDKWRKVGRLPVGDVLKGLLSQYATDKGDEKLRTRQLFLATVAGAKEHGLIKSAGDYLFAKKPAPVATVVPPTTYQKSWITPGINGTFTNALAQYFNSQGPVAQRLARSRYEAFVDFFKRNPQRKQLDASAARWITGHTDTPINRDTAMDFIDTIPESAMSGDAFEYLRKGDVNGALAAQSEAVQPPRKADVTVRKPAPAPAASTSTFKKPGASAPLLVKGAEVEGKGEMPRLTEIKILAFLLTHKNLDDSDFHAYCGTLGVGPHEAEEVVYRAFRKAVTKQAAPDYGDPLAELTPGDVAEFVLQHHRMARRGTEHNDLRIGVQGKNKGLYSWAVPKADMPEPGDKRLVSQTVLHDFPYGNFQGQLNSGDTVRMAQRGQAQITKVSPDALSFSIAGQKKPVRYALVKMKDPKGNLNWVLVSRIKPNEMETAMEAEAAIKTAEAPMTTEKETPAEPMVPLAIVGSDGKKKKTVKVAVADTVEKRSRGLSKVAALPVDTGMLFTKSGAFWMKDCLTALSIAFMSKQGGVVDIQEMPLSNLPNELKPLYVSRDPSAVCALEMPSGWFDCNGIKIGDRVTVDG